MKILNEALSNISILHFLHREIKFMKQNIQFHMIIIYFTILFCQIEYFAIKHNIN
jgi:hypothetical protein